MRQSFSAVKAQPGWVPFFMVSLLISGCLLLSPALSLAETQDSQKSETAEGPQAKESVDKKAEENMKKVVARAKELRSSLKDIRMKTLENNEEVAALLEDLKQSFKKKFEENLKETGVDIQRLQEISQEVKNKDMAEEKKKELQKEFQNLYSGYQEAKVKTLKNEKIQKKNKAFSQKLEVAMNEENPKAEDMMKELTLLRAQMKASVDQDTK